MKKRYAGFALIGALIYGPLLFGILIILQIKDFSFSTYAMCSLAIDKKLYHLLFYITTWGMAILHVPFILKWPSISEDLGGNKKGKRLFYLAGIIYLIGFLLFPVFLFDPDNMISYRIHQVIASFYFPSCAIIAIIPWINLKSNKKYNSLYAVVSILWMTVSLLYFLGFVIFAKSAPPYPGWINIINWLFLVLYGPWALIYGVLIIRKVPARDLLKD